MTYPSMKAALVVCIFPRMVSSGLYHCVTSNLCSGISAVQFFPSMRTFQKLSSPSPVRMPYISTYVQYSGENLCGTHWHLPPGKLHPMPTTAISSSMLFASSTILQQIKKFWHHSIYSSVITVPDRSECMCLYMPALHPRAFIKLPHQ